MHGTERGEDTPLVVTFSESGCHIVAYDAGGYHIGKHPFGTIACAYGGTPVVDGDKHEHTVVHVFFAYAPEGEQFGGVVIYVGA